MSPLHFLMCAHVVILSVVHVGGACSFVWRYLKSERGASGPPAGPPALGFRTCQMDFCKFMSGCLSQLCVYDLPLMFRLVSPIIIIARVIHISILPRYCHSSCLNASFEKLVLNQPYLVGWWFSLILITSFLGNVLVLYKEHRYWSHWMPSFIYSSAQLQAAARATKMAHLLPLSMLQPTVRGGRETSLTVLLWQLVWSPGKMRVFNMLALWLENMAGSPSLQIYLPVGRERFFI